MIEQSNYFIGVGDALSQLANKIFLNGNPNESLSGRAHRTKSNWEPVINFIMFWDKGDHCKISHERDVVYGQWLKTQ